VLAALLPALRASRVAPLAALRDVDAARTRPGRLRTGSGLALLPFGVAGLATGSFLGAGAGALLVLAGAVLAAPAAAAAGTRLLGAPLRTVTGELARGNAARDPRRAASSAAALVVGVGVVTLFTVFAASLSASVERDATRSFGGDLAVASDGFGGSALSPRIATEIAELPEVRAAVGIGRGTVVLDGRPTAVGAADPAALAGMLDLDVAAGNVADLGRDGIAVAETIATERGWTTGTAVPVSYSDGATERLTVRAVYRSTDAVGDALLPRAAYLPHTAQPVDSRVLVQLADGVDLATGKAAVRAVAARYGAPALQDREESAAAATEGIDTLLGIVYALLALAVLTALLGIASSLSLAIGERTRELGLLRAVGQSRRQVRATVRWESVLVSVLGTGGGLLLGLLLGWGLVRAVDTDSAFAAPALQLTVVLVAGAVAGVLAAVRPARRAARTDVLRAIATE
jgi:putative ABC transport system permease protein